MAKKIIAYKILPELKLIIEVAYGEISLAEIIELKSQQPKNPLYNPTYNFISDIRNCNILFKEDGVMEYVAFAKKNADMLGDRFSAFITNTPLQVALATLYEQEGMELPMQFAVVSTLTAALNWIGCSFDNIDEIEAVLSDLGKG